MRSSFENFKKNTINSLLIEMQDIGIQLTQDQQENFSLLLDSQLNKTKVYSNLLGYKGSTSKYKLAVSGDNTIIGYHPINGTWVHISQVVDKEGKTIYYTNAVRQNVQI